MRTSDEDRPQSTEMVTALFEVLVAAGVAQFVKTPRGRPNSVIEATGKLSHQYLAMLKARIETNDSLM